MDEIKIFMTRELIGGISKLTVSYHVHSKKKKKETTKIASARHFDMHLLSGKIYARHKSQHYEYL